MGLRLRCSETVRLWIGHDLIIGISAGDIRNEEIGDIDDTAYDVMNGLVQVIQIQGGIEHSR